MIDPYFPIQSKYKVEAISYEGFPLFDLVGPVGVFDGARDKFSVETIGLNLIHHMKEAIQKDWDILLTPGGNSVCTGSFILAKTGLINGFKAMTNITHYTEATSLYPDVEWEPNARWVHHRQFITSSGVTAGIDAAFYILALAKNIGEAKKFSKVLEYLPDWDPDNDPFAVNATNI